MVSVSYFSSNTAFGEEFQRCAKQYQDLDMYTAWIGDSKNVIPFEFLHALSKITAVVGIAFCQSHPEGIKLLMDIAHSVMIAQEEILYHPKVYIFSKGREKAVFIGSSNFTYQGFYKNIEVNVLLEGKNRDKEISILESNLRKWHSKEYSFKPDKQWLKQYSIRFNRRRQKSKMLVLMMN